MYLFSFLFSGWYGAYGTHMFAATGSTTRLRCTLPPVAEAGIAELGTNVPLSPSGGTTVHEIDRLNPRDDSPAANMIV